MKMDPFSLQLAKWIQQDEQLWQSNESALEDEDDEDSSAKEEGVDADGSVAETKAERAEWEGHSAWGPMPVHVD